MASLQCLFRFTVLSLTFLFPTTKVRALCSLKMASLQSLFCFSVLSLTFLFPTAKSQTGTNISTDPSYYYNLCAPFRCNNLTLRYPLIPTQFCHDPNIVPTCPNNEYLLLRSPQPSDTYRVVSNITGDSTSETLFVAANSLFGCGQVSQPNYNLDPSIFSLLDNYTYGTHLNCTRTITSNTILPASCLDCDANRSSNVCYYVRGFLTVSGCEPYYTFPPIGANVNAVKDLRAFFQKGFEVRYTKPLTCQSCEASGGRCGASPQQNFLCFCPSSVHNTNCLDGAAVDLSTWVPSGGSSKKLVAALSASAPAVVLISLATIAIIVIRRQRRLKEEEHDDGSGPDENGGTQTDFNDLVTSIAPAKYSYSQILKFTSHFSNKLGQGGFGSVYKGIIKQGRGNELHVAIKVLKDSKQREKQFMNEVATVGRIHHSNLVRMLGYCVEGKTRALVYEFVEKGSLEKYIHNTKRQSEKRAKEEEDKYTPGVERLSPQQLYNIAIETARGILYLHQGCRSTILHCDIKPHNVLLDSNYSAKVADFGLARMIDKDRSHVSLTVAQGTPGYAPPEMWSKSYGPITEKSDVYSYGMLLLEMAGGRKNYDTGASTSSQIYFPEWAFQRLARGNLKADRTETGTETVSSETAGDEKEDKEDGDVLRKMCLVGLWCIQFIPSKRPSMSKVIQMLEGKAEIGTPPHPFSEESGELTFTYCSTSNSNVDVSTSKTEEDEEDGH